MVVEFNPIVVRLSTATAIVKKEKTMVERHCKLQVEDHDGYHIPHL